jgi:hypothetical protein
MQEFKVLREHHGDKPYVRGDTRKADAQAVAHLVLNGVLADVNAEPQKQVPAKPAATKAAKKAPENK